MQKDTLLCFLSGITFENLDHERKFDQDLTICRNTEDITPQLRKDNDYEFLCDEDYDNIRNCALVIKVPVNGQDRGNKNAAVSKTKDFIKVLRVVQSNVVYPQYFIVHYSDGHYFPHLPPATLSACYDLEMSRLEAYEMSVARNKKMQDTKKEELLRSRAMGLRKMPVQKLDDVASLWKNMPTAIKNNKRVAMALCLNEKAYREWFREIRTLFFAMALESLFATRDAELTFSLALRTARFVEESCAERETVFDQICRAYDIRSKIAHGMVSKIREDKLWDAELIFRENVRKSLLKVLQDAQTIKRFDESKEHESFLKTLVLNDGA